MLNETNPRHGMGTAAADVLKKKEEHNSLGIIGFWKLVKCVVFSRAVGTGFAYQRSQGAAPDDANGHRASRRCTFYLLISDMILRMPKPVFFLTALMALFVLGSKADAGLLHPGSGMNHDAPSFRTDGKCPEAAEDSWVPYLAEFSEVSSYLQSAMKSPVGFLSDRFALGFSSESETIAEFVAGDCDPGIPANQLVLIWRCPFEAPYSAAQTGGSTSGSSPPERNSNPQAGLAVRQQLIRSEEVTWLADVSKDLPGTPLDSRLFRPPRAAA